MTVQSQWKIPNLANNQDKSFEIILSITVLTSKIVYPQIYSIDMQLYHKLDVCVLMEISRMNILKTDHIQHVSRNYEIMTLMRSQ